MNFFYWLGWIYDGRLLLFVPNWTEYRTVRQQVFKYILLFIINDQ